MLYTHSDAKGFERGDMGKNKPKVARIYVVDSNRSDKNLTYVKSCGMYGEVYEEVFPTNTIVKLENPIKR
jgi:hypothetical protein